MPRAPGVLLSACSVAVPLCGCMACSVAVPRFWHSLVGLWLIVILLGSRKRLLALELGKCMIETLREPFGRLIWSFVVCS